MKFSRRTYAVLKALLVTFLWSTSWVLIKKFIHAIHPLTFAGLRYSLAVFLLIPNLWKHKEKIKSIEKGEWGLLVLLGIVYYAITQGGQFLTLRYLDATTFSLLLNFTSILAAVFGYLFLREKPSLWQWIGTAVFLFGAYLYFSPSRSLSYNPIGFIIAGITIAGNSIAAVLGRYINHKRNIPPAFVTGISMGIGAILLLSAGLMIGELPELNAINVVVIFWLAAINTAFAFTLWNQTLQVLTAFESSLINNSMLIQISVLAWIFLGEKLVVLSIVGLMISFTGLLLANIGNKKNQ